MLIIDGVTNRNFFEFYIQPQEVTQGSAIPICFHVAYGDLKMDYLIPKLTYDLCHIYNNWQGTVLKVTFFILFFIKINNL